MTSRLIILLSVQRWPFSSRSTRAGRTLSASMRRENLAWETENKGKLWSPRQTWKANNWAMQLSVALGSWWHFREVSSSHQHQARQPQRFIQTRWKTHNTEPRASSSTNQTKRERTLTYRATFTPKSTPTSTCCKAGSRLSKEARLPPNTKPKEI